MKRAFLRDPSAHNPGTQRVNQESSSGKFQIRGILLNFKFNVFCREKEKTLLKIPKSSNSAANK